MLNCPISPVNLLLDGATITVLLFPLAASMWLQYVANQCAATGERTKWVGYTRCVSPLMILVVPAWWSLSVAIRNSSNNLSLTAAIPLWLLLVIPPSLSMVIARLVSYRADAHVFGKRLTGWNIFLLAFWRTASSTFPLLIVAVAMDDIYNRNIAGFAWMIAAGIVVLLGRMRLMAAEGLRPRPVKSGELYKRSTVMAKKMGVRLRRVCVVPFGRGHLTNAYGGLTQIAVTDDYGRWLHGSQLEFVICHELAHLKQKDALKTLSSTGAIFAAVSTPLLVMPQLSMPWRVFLNFLAILLPLMVFYALSRSSEYKADRLAVEMTGEPAMAIRALVGLYRRADVPSQLGRFAELFSTHPRLWSRVDAIARQGRVSAAQVSEARESFMETRTGIGRS